MNFVIKTSFLYRYNLALSKIISKQFTRRLKCPTFLFFPVISSHMLIGNNIIGAGISLLDRFIRTWIGCYWHTSGKI